MNADVKRDWVAALRGGTYKQFDGGFMSLFKQRYCCLGVLCDISGWGQWSDCLYMVDGCEAKAFHPPMSVLEWAGLAYDEAIKLARLNDRGDNFAQIADYIEEHY